MEKTKGRVDITLNRKGNFFGYEIKIIDCKRDDISKFTNIANEMNILLDERIRDMMKRFRDKKIKQAYAKAKGKKDEPKK